MAIINFRAKKIIWKHTGNIDSSKAVVVNFLANNKEEQKILSEIFEIFLTHRDMGLTGRAFEGIKERHNIPKATFWRILKRLERVGIIKIGAGGGFYYIGPDFAKALSKVSRAYRKMF